MYSFRTHGVSKLALMNLMTRLLSYSCDTCLALKHTNTSHSYDPHTIVFVFVFVFVKNYRWQPS
jgi:hypothetical protein